MKLLLLILLPILLLLHCGGGAPGEKPRNPGVLLGDLTFDFHENAGARFKELIAKNDLAKHFKTDWPNTFCKENQWIGRIRDHDVSYHSMFAVDDSAITCKAVPPGVQELHFSIYHPEGSHLEYTVTMESDGTSQTLFQRSFNKKSFYDGFIAFKESPAGDVKMVFRTSGLGVGAWVNPRFHKVKQNPRVFVVIVLDTLRYDHTSVYGYHRKTTPFMEKLAQDGVVYKSAFSSTSWTLPAHVSLFSGKDLSEHGVVAPEHPIPETFPLAAEVFQDRGFVTAAFTGGGFVEDSYGFYRGFQYYSNAPGNVFSMNSAHRVLSHFKKYIKRYHGQDLFIFLHTYQVHAPYKAPGRYIDAIDMNVDGNLVGIFQYIKEKNNYYRALEDADRQQLIDLYDASILYADEVLVGGVMDYLKEKGYYDNAMITVLSDHGEEFYDHGSWEHGHTLYNELIKIPLVIKYPGGNKKGIEQRLTSITDISGLMLENAGFEFNPEDFPVNIGAPDRLLPVLFPVSPIIKQFLSKISFVDENFHFIFNHIDEEKLAFFDPSPGNIPAYELYLRGDLQEKQNVYKEYFNEVRRFKKYLKKMERKLKMLKRRNRIIDKDLEETLKSLGYLGN